MAIYVLKWSPKSLTCEGSTTPPVNQPPVAPSVASLSAISGSSYSTTLPVFTDPDTGDELAYSLKGSVPGLTFNAETRVLTGTPTTTGTFSLTYSATDGTASTSVVFGMTVASPPIVNQPPVAPPIASLSATVGQSFTGTLPVFTDPENDPLTYALTGTVPGLTLNSANRFNECTPTQAGSFTLIYAANDGKVTVPTTVTLTVVNPAPVNQPPVAPAPVSVSATVGQSFATTLPVFTDPENGALTYSLSGSVAGLSFEASSRNLSGTPTTTGVYSLTYAATDNQSLSASVAVTVTVSNSSTTPPLSLAGYDGYLSTANCDLFSGWVWHRDKPNTPLMVEFLDGATAQSATVIATILADVFRQDLKTAGKGNGNHSYSLDTPRKSERRQSA